MRWMTSLTSGRFQPPLSLTEGNTVDFVFRLSNNGTLFTPPLTPVWIFGIKDADTPNGDFLIQVNSATVASGVYTFVVELASAELQTWLATATSQSYAAIQITDSANDIATAPLLCQIAPNQNDTGTTPTSANGTLSVAAGKTVTFPQSLTFPSALGTNTFQLSTDGAGTLTWTAAGGVTDGDKGDITVSASGATWTIDNDVVTLAKLAHMATARVVGRTTAGTGSPELLTISGTGSVAMTTNPQFTTPTLGAATATSLNAATGTLTLGVQTINLAAGSGTNSAGGSINLSGVGSSDNAYGGSISLSGSTEPGSHGGSINLSAGAGVNCVGGSLNLSGSEVAAGGSINMSGGSVNGGSITTTAGGSITTGTGNLTGPSASGTIALTTDVIAGQYGGTGVANTSKTITLGASLTTTGAGATTFALGAGTQTYTFPTTTATLARTDAAQTFSGVTVQTFTNTALGGFTVTSNTSTSGNLSATTATMQITRLGLAFGHVALALRSPAGTAGTLGYDAILSVDDVGRLNLGGGGSSTSFHVCSNNSSGNSGAAVSLTAAGNITAIGALAITGASTLTGNLTSNGALISTPQALSGTTLGAINITTLTTTLAATGVATATLTATGVANGQIKVIVMTQATGACTVTVTNASWGGVTTAVFDAVGETLMLQYLNSKWTPISNIGVALA